MIKTEKEYELAKSDLLAYQDSIDALKAELESNDLPPNLVDKALMPQKSFYAQCKEDIDEYENLKEGNFDEIDDYSNIGVELIKARIFRKLSQAELAERLDVDPSQVSRDERNEYYNVGSVRITKVLNALNMKIRSQLQAA